VLSAADAVGPSNCAACDAPVAAASGGSNGSSWRQRPVSRRQRRSKHLRTTTFSIFHYDILCTGETRATRTIDMYDAREHGGRGDTSDISCTGAGAVMPAAAVMAEEDRSGAHSLFGYTVEVDHDYDSSSARAANYDGDVVSYNSLLLRRVSSSVIERAAALSAAAATVTSTSSPVEFVASVGADPPAAEGSLIPSGEPTEAQRPAIDPRIAFVHDEGIDNTTAAAAAAMAVALRGDGGDVSPFTSLAATAAAIDYDTTGGAADPFVLTSLPNPVLIPCAFVPPASSTARIRMAIQGLPASWAPARRAPPAELEESPAAAAAAAGDGINQLPDWGSGHAGTMGAVVGCTSVNSPAMSLCGVHHMGASGGGGGGGGGGGSGGSSGGLEVEVAVRSGGRYLPVEWGWRPGQSSVGKPASVAVCSEEDAAATAPPLELSICGVLGPGLVEVEVWFRGVLYVSLPAISSHDSGLVSELLYGPTPMLANQPIHITQPQPQVTSSGMMVAVNVGDDAEADVEQPTAAPLPLDVLYDLGLWMQYTSSVMLAPLRAPSGPAVTTSGRPPPPPPPRGHHQHHHREQQQEVLVAGEVGRRTVGGEGAVRLNGGMMPEVVRQQQRQAVANDPPSVDGAVSRMSPHDVAQQQHYRSSVDFEQRQFDSVATLHGGGGTGSDSGRAGVLVSPPPQHQIHPPYNNPRPRHVDNTAGARSPITNGLRRSGTGSAEAPSGSTLSYNYSEVLVPLPVPLPRAEILQPAATYADPTGPMIAPFLDVGSATSLFSSARLPRIAASLTAAPLRLSFTSHTGLVSEASAGTGTGAAPAAAPTTSPTVEVRHRGCGLGAASCTAATRPPSARAPRGTTVVRAGEPLSLLTGQLLQPANTLDPVAVQTAAASAAAPTALAAATTAGGMMAAAHGVPATGRFSPAAASRHRAVQDSAVDITVPIMPGSLDLASMVSGLQRGPEYGQHMQDMAVPLLAWLCRAGRPVAAGTVLRGLIQHRGMRFVDVCAEVRRQPQYDGMSFLHLAVQSGSRAMLAAVAEWQQTYGSVLAWDELCTVGLAPVHLAAALAVTRASEPETLDGRAADAMTDPRVGGGVSGGSDGGRGSTLNEAGLATLTWLLQHYPAVRGMWSTALDAYGSTPGAILSFQLAGLTPDAADRVRSALLPLVGPEEVWCKSVLAAPSGSGSSGLGDCGDGAAARQLLGDGLWGRVAATLEHWLAAVRRPPLPLVPTDTAGSTSMARNEPGGTVVALLVAAVLWLLLCSVL
ncbi:hypothetical protein Vretifemale_11606, partial [Volvox reticuliferus]